MAKRKAKKKALVLLTGMSPKAIAQREAALDSSVTPAQRAVALGNRLEHLSDPTEARKILDKRKRG